MFSSRLVALIVWFKLFIYLVLLKRPFRVFCDLSGDLFSIGLGTEQNPKLFEMFCDHRAAKSYRDKVIELVSDLEKKLLIKNMEIP